MDKQSPLSSIPRRPRISREFVFLHRRRRFALAAAEVVHEFGIHGVTVGILVQLAGTARNSFYDVFGSANDCLAFAVADAHERLFEPVRAARGEGEWLVEVEAAIAGFYREVAADPLAAELFLIHSFGVGLGPEDVSFETGAADLERSLGGGRAAAAAGSGPPVPRLAEEYWGRVVLAGAEGALRRQDLAALPGLATELALLIGSSFLGAEVAAEALPQAATLQS
jgi:AcrR family transcriptional regulator